MLGLSIIGSERDWNPAAILTINDREEVILARQNFTPAERFQKKLVQGPNGCSVWTGYVDEWGYGTFWFDGRLQKAHRVAWILKHGPIPNGILVCHRCDNPACCNAESHLFLGTPADNTADMVAKGRGAKLSGSNHSQAKLTWEDVQAIRNSTEPALSICVRFGVTRNYIYKIRSKEKWVHDESRIES